MARNSGDEDNARFVRDNEYVITVNDALGLKVTNTDVIPGNPIMSASVSVPILSASTATATVTATQHFVLADATAAEMGLTLPSAVTSIGRTHVVKKIDRSTNAVLVSASSGQSIEGAAFQTITGQSGSIMVMSDGVGWHIVASFSGVLLT